MKPRRPLIAVTGPDRGGTAAWLFSAFAVWRAGGRPRRFTPRKNRSLEGVHGVIIGGGSDVSPELYDREQGALELVKEVAEEEEKLADNNASLADRLMFPIILFLRLLFSSKHGNRLDPDRDRMENDIIAHALEQGLPLMGICRGSQLLNVHLGGTLHQDLGRFYEETPQVRDVFPRKKIFIEEDSQLAKVLRRRTTMVNALHDQAVDQAGTGIEPVARETTGVIQGIEYREKPFVLGVQWHPEYMPQVRSQVRLFRRLVEEARSIITERG